MGRSAIEDQKDHAPASGEQGFQKRDENSSDAANTLNANNEVSTQKKGASCETPLHRCAWRGREAPSARDYAARGAATAGFAPSVPIGIWRGFCA
jgi:hypothetical protein